MVDGVAEAYSEAFASSLPGRWRRRLHAEARKGDQSALDEMTVDVFKAARTWAPTKGLDGWGHGVVMQYIAHLRTQRAKATAQRQHETKLRLHRAIERCRTDESADATTPETDERLATFRELPIDEQRRRIEAARQANRFIRRPDLLEQIAAMNYVDAKSNQSSRELVAQGGR